MLDAQDLVLPLILLSVVVVFLIAAIVIVAIVSRKLFKSFTSSMNKNYENYKDELKAQNDILLKELIKQSAINDEQHGNDNGTGDNNTNTEKDLMNIFLKLRGAIRENCVTSMTQIGAARLAIYLLHNGSRSTHGINFFKMSCICEKVAVGSGIRERMIEHTNIPINLFDEMIDKLITNNRYIIMNDYSVQSTNQKIFISAQKINYTQLIAIYDINNNMLGFVAAEMDKPYDKNEADKEKKVLDDLVKQLVPVLSYSDYISMESNINTV